MPPRARSHGSSAERQRRERSLLFPFCLFCSSGFLSARNMLASLTCSRKCCSQGGYAPRPHPHVVRGAAAAAPQVLGLLPVRESSNARVHTFMFFFSFWPSDPDVLVIWVVSGAQASRYHILLEGRLVSVLHSLVNFVHGHFRLQHPVCLSLCICLWCSVLWTCLCLHTLVYVHHCLVC